MLRFLRKYNTIILVIGGAFLMVAFLVPQAIQQIGGSPMTAPVFRLQGQNYGRTEIQQAQQDIQVLSFIGQAAQFQNSLALPVSLPLDPDNVFVHWLMLTHEADRLGLIGGQNDGVQYLDDLQLRNDSLLQSPSARFNAMLEARDRLAQTGLPYEQIDSSLARARGVSRLFNLINGAFQVSAPESITEARQLADTVVGQVTLVSASSLIEQISEPSEEQLLEHFQTYREQRAQDNPFSITYRQPAAARVQSITIDRNAIRSAITLDPIRVRAHWQRNQGQFGQDFQTARTRVENALRDERVDAIMREIEATVRTQIVRSRRGLSETDGYFELPEDWSSRRVNLEALAREITEQLGDNAPIDGSAVKLDATQGEWSTEADLRSLTPRFSRTDATLTGMSFPLFVLSVRELNPDTPPPFPAQTGILLGPLTDFNGSLSWVRVDAVRPEGPAPSLDVVREQALQNLRLLRAYDLLVDRIDSIRATIVQAGNVAVVSETFPEAEVLPSAEFTRSSVRNPADNRPSQRLNVESLRNAVMDAVTDWPPDRLPSEVDNDQRTIVEPIPSQLAVAGVFITSRYPATFDWTRLNDMQVLQAVARQYQTIDLPQNFSFQAMSQRLNYQPIMIGDEEDEQQTEQEAANDS